MIEEGRQELTAYDMWGVRQTFKLVSSNNKYIGRQMQNTRGEWYTVVGVTDIKVSNGKNNSHYGMYLVQFGTNIKNRFITGRTAVIRGSIINPLTPVIFDVGYKGIGKYNSSTHSYFYTTWYAMFQRCYSLKYWDTHPTYKDCSVDPRWHNFQNFCEDIQHLEGYAEWKMNTKKYAYALDKDIKVQGNKIYSKNTCMFVTLEENNIQAHTTGKTYKAFNTVTKEEILFTNIAQFVREQKIRRQSIYECLNNTRLTYKNWTFEEYRV